MAAPAADRLGVGDQRVDEVAEPGAEDSQGEPGPGLAEGAGGEGAAGQERDMGQGGVAVEDRDEEPVEDGRRGQETGIAPGVSGGAAGGEEDVVAELGGEVLSQRVADARNPAMHRGASCAMGVGEKPMVHGGPGYLNSQGPLALVDLMPFTTVPEFAVLPRVRLPCWRATVPVLVKGTDTAMPPLT